MDIRLNCIVNLRIFTRNSNHKDVIMNDHHSILFITRSTLFGNRSSHFDNTSSRFNKTKNYFNTRSRNFKAFQVSEAATNRVFFKKRCSENMQQIYRRTPMPKSDFNKVALQLWTAALKTILL